MCGIRVLGAAARATCGASMAWPHGSAASRRRDDARARATGPSRRGATAAAATGLDAARSRRASDVRRLDGVAKASARAERARACGSATASSTQAIDMYTYWHLGEPLLVLDAVPRAGEHSDRTHVVVRGLQRQKPPRGATTKAAPPKEIYTLYGKTNNDAWRLVAGINKTKPTNYLNLKKLMACARNPNNNWGNFDQGTVEQMNARAPRQLQELWDACGTKPTSLLSMEEGNSIVNGASTCVCIFCPFPTQVRVALYTTEADDSPLAVCRLWARILSAKLKRKGSCGCLMDL